MLIDQHALAVSIIEVTERVYQVEPWRGEQAEPITHAWQRLFGETMSPPLLFHYVRVAGRELVVRCHDKGRVSVLDQLTGRHEIRTLRRQWERAVNAATERQQSRGEERMASAALRFLQTRVGT